MMTNEELATRINWPAVLAEPRYAGGHSEVMAAIFKDAGKVLGSWEEGDYSGEIAWAYEFPDGTVAIITDSYGSCSGCDSWTDSSEKNARAMVEELVKAAKLYPSSADATAALKAMDTEEWGLDFSPKAAANLIGNGL